VAWRGGGCEPAGRLIGGAAALEN